jgi:multiple sugar transport system substrate-binding protein
MSHVSSARPSPVLALAALAVIASLVSGACNPNANKSATAGASTGPAGASEPGGVGASQAPTSGGSAAPAGSAASQAPGASGAGTANISGDLLVLAKYKDADEIATTRYDVFKKQYPGVNVKFTEADFDAQTFLPAVASGNAPDVVQMDRNLIGTYIANGALEPLDECISSRSIDMGQFRKAAVTQVTFDGKVYGIPQFFNTDIVMINQSVLDEVGLKPEDIDTSDWDKLKTVNEKLMKKSGDKITRIGFDPKLPELLPLWAAANGASLISEDGKESKLDDPKVAEALEFAASLVTAHGKAANFFDFRDKSSVGHDIFADKTLFTEDELGAFPFEPFYLNVMANNTPDEAVSFQPFKNRQGQNVTLSGGTAWVVTAKSKNKEAACEFARVVTLPDTWYAAAKARADKRKADKEAFTGTYTGNTVADERIFSELVNEQTAGKFYEGVKLVLDTADSAVTLPVTPAAEAFNNLWTEAAQRVLNGQASAADALADADQEAQDAIDSAQ